jgi:hypothetical protein
MRQHLSTVLVLASLGAGLIAPAGIAAEIARPTVIVTQAQATPPAASPSANQTAPAQVPRGAEEVLKLSRAQISEDTILSFVHNSSTVCSLTAKDILYLHGEGVSDRVINAMLEQHAKAAALAIQSAPPAPPPAPAYPTSSAVAAAPSYVQPASSTVYVTSPAPTSYYYYPPAYYPAYYNGWWWPPVSLSFGFGHGFGHGHWHR